MNNIIEKARTTLVVRGILDANDQRFPHTYHHDYIRHRSNLVSRSAVANWMNQVIDPDEETSHLLWGDHVLVR